MAEKPEPAAETPLERAVRSLADVHARHIEELPRSQLGIEWLTDGIGRPWFVGDNLIGRHGRFDSATFPLLQLLLAIFSLVMASFILITENRQSTLAEKRMQLALHLLFANEERAAKMIEQMAEPADVHTALEKMEQAEAEARERANREAAS